MNRDEMIASVRALLESQPSNDDRKQILNAITENVCEHCGKILNGSTCHCHPCYDE